MVAEYNKVNKSVILSHVPLSILNLAQEQLDEPTIDDISHIYQNTEFDDTTSMFTDFNAEI